ncbi:YecA family protein [Aeromonas sp. A04]|uniref:YecA family protein n=1 Tax=Aeromonas sp. A04 TaxID=3398359 RepID=UPI0039F6DB4A
MSMEVGNGANMTSIFIANSPSVQVKVAAKEITNKEKIEFIWGYHSENDIKDLSEGILSTIFSSLITHDEVYLKPTTILFLIKEIGIVDVLKLQEQKIFKVAFGLDDFVVKLGRENLSLAAFTFEWSSIEGVEKRILKENKTTKDDANKLIQYIENNSVFCEKEKTKIVTSEISSDLSNAKIRTSLGINSQSLEELSPFDSYSLIRLSTIAQGLIIQNGLGIDSIYQDGYTKDYIGSKFGAFSSTIGSDPTQVFGKILNLKGIPDIYSLYKKKVIGVDDIINYRKNFNGTIFREWLASEDYSQEEVVRTLINNESKEGQASKLIRFLYPNIVGVLNPVLGAAASAFDSYIVGKVLDGWKPSLFLDDVLKRNVDNKIRIFKRQKEKEKFIERFGSVGRNDPCPCQSGKKFKTCHGA